MTKILLNNRFISISEFHTYCIEYSYMNGTHNVCISISNYGSNYYQFQTKKLAEDAVSLIQNSLFEGKESIKITTQTQTQPEQELIIEVR